MPSQASPLQIEISRKSNDIEINHGETEVNVLSSNHAETVPFGDETKISFKGRITNQVRQQA